MNQIVRVGKPYIEKTENGKSRLCAVLSEDGKEPYTAWYEVEEQYEAYLCTERADAFVVVLVPYALRHGLDIHCEQDVSEQLLYQLNQILLPALSNGVAEFTPAKVVANPSNVRLPSHKARGVGVSGGVDSFYAILNHLNRKESSYNITHLTFFNVGASGDSGGDRARELYLKRLERVKKIAQQLRLPLLSVDSNISEYLGLTHVCSHTYRSLSAVLALQKFFSGYFYASGYVYQEFGLSSQDSARYDLLNLQCLSTENTSFCLSGAEITRQGKLEFLSKHEVTHTNLNVCVTSESNCNRCSKCRRTMMGLYLGGNLELYRPVFNVDWFTKGLGFQIADVCAERKFPDRREQYLELKRRHMVYPHHYLVGFVRKCLRDLIIRGGKAFKLYLKITRKA